MDRFQQSAMELCRHLKKVSGEFEKLVSRGGTGKLDDEGLHRLRVFSRRLRSTLWLIEQGSDKLSFKKLDRKLRKLGRVLGEQRQLEVLMSDAATYKVKCPGLKARKRSSQKKLMRFLRPKTQAKLARLLAKAIRKTEKTPTLNIGIAGQKLKTRLDPWLKRPPHTPARLHQLRIQIKKARYALEALGNNVVPIEKLQDTLGRSHDLEMLKTKLGRKASLARIQKAEVAQTRRAQKMIVPALRFTLMKLRELSLPHQA